MIKVDIPKKWGLVDDDIGLPLPFIYWELPWAEVRNAASWWSHPLPAWMASIAGRQWHAARAALRSAFCMFPTSLFVVPYPMTWLISTYIYIYLFIWLYDYICMYSVGWQCLWCMFDEVKNAGNMFKYSEVDGISCRLEKTMKNCHTWRTCILCRRCGNQNDLLTYSNVRFLKTSKYPFWHQSGALTSYTWLVGLNIEKMKWLNTTKTGPRKSLIHTDPYHLFPG